MLHQYSLADHQVTIGWKEIANLLGLTDNNGNIISNFTIGGPGENGEGSFVGQITINRSKDLYTTEGDATGSWVHNKNLDRTGTITIQITQISEDVIKLAQLCQIFESIQTNTPGMEVTVASTASGVSTPIASGKDCYITKLPEIAMGETAARLDWVLTCGQITYYQ